MKLLVEEAEVHHHVVTNDGFADLSHFLDYDTEAELVLQHAFDLRFDVLF